MISHLDLGCLQKPIIIAYGSERVNRENVLKKDFSKIRKISCHELVCQGDGILSFSGAFLKLNQIIIIKKNFILEQNLSLKYRPLS